MQPKTNVNFFHFTFFSKSTFLAQFAARIACHLIKHGNLLWTQNKSEFYIILSKTLSFCLMYQ